MSRHMIICAVLAPLLLLAVSPASMAAQQERQPLRIWVMAGLGLGGAPDADGVAGTLQLAAQRAPHQITVRLVSVVPVVGRSTDAGEIGVLYGRTFTGETGHLGIGAGIGLVASEPCSGTAPECSLQYRIALPIAAEASLRVLPIAGIGAQVFANVSGSGLMSGAVIFVQLGWLPRR